MKNLKQIAKLAIPPILMEKGVGFLGLNNRWTGSYRTWEEALEKSAGYDSTKIFEATLSAARSVRDGKALWERDSVCFSTREFNWELLACLFAAAAIDKGTLRVLDFGGSLGSTYFQHRDVFDRVMDLSWSIVEQKPIVEIGALEFQTERLRFFETVELAMTSSPINVIVLSGVLQYLADPYTLLRDLVCLKPTAIVIDRTAISTVERIAVQHVPKAAYKASYPCRFMRKRDIEEILSDGRELYPWFQSRMDPRGFGGVMSLLAKT